MLARWRSRGSAGTEPVSNLAEAPRAFDGGEPGCFEKKADPEASAHRIDIRIIVIRMILSYQLLNWFDVISFSQRPAAEVSPGCIQFWSGVFTLTSVTNLL